MEKQLGWCSIEQSKKLIEAGLDPNTADMHLWEAEGKIYTYCGKGSDLNCIPCWSLGALIGLMPEITMLVRDSTGITPSYFISIGPSEFGEDIFMSEQYSTPLEAAVSTIIWLLENNYIKKEETK